MALNQGYFIIINKPITTNFTSYWLWKFDLVQAYKTSLTMCKK